MRKLMTFLVVAAFLTAACEGIAFSEEKQVQPKQPAQATQPTQVAQPVQATQPAQPEKEVGYAYGVVAEKTAEAITIKEVSYNEETGEEVTKNETYYITPTMELENLASAGDLKPEDEVDIEYVEKDGKKQISYIYRYTAETTGEGE